MHVLQIQLTMHDIQGRSIFERKSFYNLAMQKPQISMPMPHLKFVRILELKNEGNVKEGSKSPVIYVYETKKHVIRVFKNIVNIEDKLPILDINFFEFYDEFSYDGGGCLKLITNDPTVYHR